MIKAKDEFMAKVQTAFNNNDQKAIADLEMKFSDPYKQILKSPMKKAYEYGKNNSSKEMGKQVPPNSAESLANIDLLADTIAYKTASDIESKAKIAAANAYKKDVSTLQSMGAIDAELEDVIQKSIDNTSSIIIGQNVNFGRNDVFQRYQSDIYALQRSEILDAKTCDFCVSMDGRVISPTDKWASTDIFHGNCRGIWVEILKDEENPPEITGIPDELGDYYGGQPNALIQPPRPMVNPGTLQEDYVKKQKEKNA